MPRRGRYTEPRCGTCHPPDDDTPGREAIDRFAQFLQAVSDGERLADGRVRIPPDEMRYALGLEADAPIPPEHRADG